MSATAERLGISSGMTPSQAQARCPKLRVLHRLAGEETQAQQDLLQAALQWTPDYESTAPGLCLLEFTRVRGLWRQREACGQQLYEWLARRDLEARIGFAANPDLAGLAAQVAQPVLIIGEEPGLRNNCCGTCPSAHSAPEPGWPNCCGCGECARWGSSPGCRARKWPAAWAAKVFCCGTWPPVVATASCAGMPGH